MNYLGKTAVLTTKHQKEQVIAPAFATHLQLVTELHLADTDQLGTFSGTIPRLGTMHETVITKARLGMTALNCKLGIASEGSFGPHPSMPFIPCDIETMVFIDDEIGFQLTETIISEDTNYQEKIIAPDDKKSYQQFCDAIGYPEHGIITSDTPSGLKLLSDMRAHMNPRRMKIIAQLAEKLAQRLACCCPKCNISGFGVTEKISGLPCEYCGEKTRLLKSELYSCVKCSYQELHDRADEKKFAEQQYCPQCNP